MTDRLDELEARIKGLEETVEEHHHYFQAAALEEPSEDKRGEIAQYDQLGKRTPKEIQAEIDEKQKAVKVDHDNNKKEAEEALAASNKEREKLGAEATTKINKDNAPVNKALEALRQGKPLVNEKI